MTASDSPTSKQTLSLSGFPSPAEDFQEDRLDLNRLVIRHPQATFFVRAAGDALRESGIRTGDILVVDRSLTVTNNCVVIAAAYGELIVRRVDRKKGRVRLMPVDNHLDPLELGGETSPETSLTIWGVVTHVLHDLRPSGSR